MSKPLINKVEFGQVPMLVRIGEAERLFGISRSRLMKLVKAGKVRTIRLGERGQHRFPVFELASALGMGEMVPRLAIPIGRELLRNIDAEVIGAARTAFRHEMRSELDKLRDDFRGMIREAAELRRPPRPAINKPLKGWPPDQAQGGY
mgnify:CR=1 FL=1